MADTPTVTSSEPRTPPSSAAEQARLRKERREAKIRAGGSARLDKITGLGGGISRGEHLSRLLGSLPTISLSCRAEGIDSPKPTPQRSNQPYA